jgi:histidine kinase-like protein
MPSCTGVEAIRAKQVQCGVACDRDRGMIIVVRDPEKGFDPASIPSPVVGHNVYSEHGRGIYLVNQLTDRVGGTGLHMGRTLCWLYSRGPSMHDAVAVLHRGAFYGS